MAAESDFGAVPPLLLRVTADWPHNGAIRFVVISDTHSMHDSLTMPPGDVLLHCGDFTKKGLLEEVTSFNAWLGTLPYPHKVVIAGNHDISVFSEFQTHIATNALSHAIFLDNNTFIVPGTHIHIYGSGWNRKGRRQLPTPSLLATGSPEQPPSSAVDCDPISNNSQCDLSLRGCDILMTHDPPAGVCDRGFGCEYLAQDLGRGAPLYHVFGHVHEAYGVARLGSTVCINAALAAAGMRPQSLVHAPVVFDVLPEEVL
eukprot:TRINITY_DN17476_c0_g1_i1.p1 TRINITY_DN17476_c0_g1~~TRINITY_DN17476_c0_g1_i1.p1  ORF type:complete len:258 (-),score=34.00 TRINITY_DN17476_c0_g1_i1:42-815(-)